MRERALQKLGIPAVVVIAAAVVTLYCLWGASLLAAEQNAFSFAERSVTLNR